MIASPGVGSGLAGSHERNLPVLHSIIGVERVDAVVLRGNVEHVVGANGNADAAGIEGLGVNLAVYRELKELSKLVAVDIAGGQDSLIQVLAGTSIVIAVGQYVLCPQR